jgi:pyridoxine 5-phosphate synthase
MRELVLVLDALAVLRAFGGPGAAPELAVVAGLAELGGAGAVRLGVSEAGGPLDAAGLRALRRAVGRLELRMAPVPALVKVALEIRPDRVLLASEPGAPGERAGALDWRAWGGALGGAARPLLDAGLEVGVRVAAEPEAVKAAHAAGARGVELFTERLGARAAPERAEIAARLGDAARLAARLRLRVGLGGGLDPHVMPEALEAAPDARRVAVGRAFVARAVLVGVERAARDLSALVSR